MKFSRFCGLFKLQLSPFPDRPAPRRLKCGTYIILPSQPLVVNRYFCFFQNFFPVFPAPFRSVFRRVSGAVICDSFIILTLWGYPVNTGFAKMCRFFIPFSLWIFSSLYIGILPVIQTSLKAGLKGSISPYAHHVYFPALVDKRRPPHYN